MKPKPRWYATKLDASRFPLPASRSPSPDPGRWQETEFTAMTSNTKPNRPTLPMLLGIYSIWIGAIVAIITIPSLSFLGVLAGALVLFVWLPYWARVNWSVVADDLPATYATIAVSLIMIVLLGFMFRYDASSIGYRLVQSGWLEPREIGRLNWIEFGIHMSVFFSIYPAWRWFRRAFARKPSKATEGATRNINP